jgi:hypothetical protein
MEKYFSKNCPQFGHAHSKFFFSPVLNQKRLKNIGMKMRQIKSLPRAPTSLRPALGLLGDRKFIPEHHGSIFLKNVLIYIESWTVLEFSDPQFKL